MRPERLRPRIASAEYNAQEQVGALALVADRVSMFVWEIAIKHSRRQLLESLADESCSDELKLEKATAFGRHLVGLSNSAEHYTRYRHNGGGLMPKSEQFLHRIDVARGQISHMFDAGDEKIDTALIKATVDFANADGDNQTEDPVVAANIVLDVIDQLND
ncbi:hypothetical protein KBB17_03935 [Candidatus Saccharibacteria bacterium]|jgi:hypothetical protein|nr:hypothetical protein [Candidatus Saccharibacteria bacterium]MBP9131614.1 hypothetical protein [Candidatus Saccharibacteria bacterium]